jgi:hypothetical protein
VRRSAAGADRLDLVLQNIDERSRNKVPITGFHFGKVKRCPGLETVVDVVNYVLCCEYDVCRYIAKRQMQHCRVVARIIFHRPNTAPGRSW